MVSRIPNSWFQTVRNHSAWFRIQNWWFVKSSCEQLNYRADYTTQPFIPLFYRTAFFKYTIFGQILLSIFLIPCFKIYDRKFKVCMPWSVNCSTWTNLSWINWAPKRLRKLRWRHPPQVLRTRRFLNSIHGL